MKDMNIPYIAGLVIRAQHSDSDAFAELYALTYNKVYNYTRHYLRDDFLAQDAMQEVYILALKNIGKLNDPTVFIAWLNRICFHVCYDMTQKNRPQNDCQVLSQEILDIVQDLIMRYYNDMKLEEIAAAMEISRSSVKRYIASGQDHLKERMKG